MQPIPLSKPMTPELARAIYAVLVAGFGQDSGMLDAGDFDGFMLRAAGERPFKMKYFGEEICVNFFRRPKDISMQLVSPPTPRGLAAVHRTMRALAVLMEQK